MSARAASLAPTCGPRAAASTWAGAGRPPPTTPATARPTAPCARAGNPGEAMPASRPSSRSATTAPPPPTRARALTGRSSRSGPAAPDQGRPQPPAAVIGHDQDADLPGRQPVLLQRLDLGPGDAVAGRVPVGGHGGRPLPTRAGRSRPRRPPSSRGSFRRAFPAAPAGRPPRRRAPHGRLRGRGRHLAPVVQRRHQDRQDHREPNRPGQPTPGVPGGRGQHRPPRARTSAAEPPAAARRRRSILDQFVRFEGARWLGCLGDVTRHLPGRWRGWGGWGGGGNGRWGGRGAGRDGGGG